MVELRACLASIRHNYYMVGWKAVRCARRAATGAEPRYRARRRVEYG